MMRKKISEDEKQMQQYNLQEKELTMLIRQYFVLDKACSHSQFSKGSILEKGRHVVNLFHKQHLNILKDLSRAADPGRIRDDKKLLDELEKLFEQQTSYKHQVEAYKTAIQELDGEIKHRSKVVEKLQKQQQQQDAKHVVDASKTLEALENKLETQMIQFGTICARNKQLRNEIDHLLISRKVFLNKWNRLTDKLCKGKKIMLDLIEQATLAYNQREEWCNKVQILRIQSLRLLNSNASEMADCKRMCEKNYKLKEFFWIKGQKRKIKDLEAKELKKREMNETKLKEKLENFQKMILDVESFTKEQDISKIAKTFQMQEESNISNFKYIIDLIKETENLTDRLGRLHIEIDERYGLHDTRHLQQKGALETLEFYLEDEILDTKTSFKKLEKTDATCKKLLEGTGELFNICRCDKDPLVKLLGDNTNVQSHNVLLYLQILERKIQEMLISAGLVDKSRKSADKKRLIDTSPEIPHIYKIDEIITATPCSLCVEHEMVSDVIDILQHVYSKSEARAKLNIRLKLPGGKARLHTISHCQLPKARQLIQRRYE